MKNKHLTFTIALLTATSLNATAWVAESLSAEAPEKSPNANQLYANNVSERFKVPYKKTADIYEEHLNEELGSNSSITLGNQPLTKEALLEHLRPYILRDTGQMVMAK